MFSKRQLSLEFSKGWLDHFEDRQIFIVEIMWNHKLLVATPFSLHGLTLEQEALRITAKISGTQKNLVIFMSAPLVSHYLCNQ